MSAAITTVQAGDKDALAERLCADVLDALKAAIAARGRATLVVSGGSTPEPLFARLADDATLDWSAVTLLLADERAVPPQHAASNEAFLDRTLLTGAPSAARYVSLHAPDIATDDAALATVAARVAELPSPFDVVLLGMGDDGHTASLFPDAPDLEPAMAEDATTTVMRLHPPSQPLVRISLTLARLCATRALWLHVTGDAKRAVLEQALQAGTLPIARVLQSPLALDADRRVYRTA